MVILFHFFNELKQDWNLSKDSMFGLARKEKNEREGFFFSFLALMFIQCLFLVAQYRTELLYWKSLGRDRQTWDTLAGTGFERGSIQGTENQKNPCLISSQAPEKCSTHHWFGEGWQQIAGRSHFVCHLHHSHIEAKLKSDSLYLFSHKLCFCCYLTDAAFWGGGRCVFHL